MELEIGILKTSLERERLRLELEIGILKTSLERERLRLELEIGILKTSLERERLQRLQRCVANLLIYLQKLLFPVAYNATVEELAQRCTDIPKEILGS